MDATLIGLVIAALVIAGILYLIIHFTGYQSGGLDKERYQVSWLKIENAVDTNNGDSMQMAIVKADKLLDLALQESGAKGGTMAERLKSQQKTWSSANAVWAAHKLRNQIAHEQHVSINADTYRRAMASFRRALKDLGAV